MNKTLNTKAPYDIELLKGKNKKILRISPKTFLKNNIYEDTNELVKKNKKIKMMILKHLILMNMKI